MAKLVFTDQNFKTEVLDEPSKPVLVDFWAVWCGPCKVQGPIVAEIAQELDGKAKVGAFDVDANPQYAGQYGIMSIPTLMIFKGGKVAWQGIGLHPKEKLIAALREQLK
jgi:thioredoxin 1